MVSLLLLLTTVFQGWFLPHGVVIVRTQLSLAHPPKPISYMASTRPHATLHMSRAHDPRQRRERMAMAEVCMRPKMQSAVSASRATPTSVASSALPRSAAWLHCMG